MRNRINQLLLNKHRDEYLRSVAALKQYLRLPRHAKSKAAVPTHPYPYCDWMLRLLHLPKDQFKDAIGNEIRKFHNMFGWLVMCKPGSYCSAAMSGRAMVFRSMRYMNVNDRDGWLCGKPKKNQYRTVHCEHTFPAAQLRDLIWATHQNKPFDSPRATFEFLMRYSTCSALSREEKALTDHAQIDLERPFVRYPKGIVIYSMATGQPVSRQCTSKDLRKQALSAAVYQWEFVEDSWRTHA